MWLTISVVHCHLTLKEKSLHQFIKFLQTSDILYHMQNGTHTHTHINTLDKSVLTNNCCGSLCGRGQINGLKRLMFHSLNVCCAVQMLQRHQLRYNVTIYEVELKLCYCFLLVSVLAWLNRALRIPLKWVSPYFLWGSDIHKLASFPHME